MSSSVNLLSSKREVFRDASVWRWTQAGLWLAAPLCPSPSISAFRLALKTVALAAQWVAEPGGVWTRTRSHFKKETECCAWQIVRWIFKRWNWFSDKSVRIVTDIVCEWGGTRGEKPTKPSLSRISFPSLWSIKENRRTPFPRLIDKVCAGLEKVNCTCVFKTNLYPPLPSPQLFFSWFPFEFKTITFRVAPIEVSRRRGPRRGNEPLNKLLCAQPAVSITASM